MARANWYLSLRRYERALAVWEELLERYPDLRQGPVVQAALLEWTGEPDAAEAILRRLLDERPDDPPLLSQIGDLRLGSGDRESAKAFYDRALEIDPRFAYAAFRRGMLAEADGDLELAVRLYRQVTTTTNPAAPLAVHAAVRLQAFRSF